MFGRVHWPLGRFSNLERFTKGLDGVIDHVSQIRLLVIASGQLRQGTARAIKKIKSFGAIRRLAAKEELRVAKKAGVVGAGTQATPSTSNGAATSVLVGGDDIAPSTSRPSRLKRTLADGEITVIRDCGGKRAPTSLALMDCECINSFLNIL